MALPRRQLPNHHRNEPAINEHSDISDDSLTAFDDAVDNWRGYLGSNHDTVVNLVRAVFDAAAAVLAVDAAVDSAGDGVSGPADNTLQRLRDEWLDTLANHWSSASAPAAGPISNAARRYVAARDRNH